MKNKGIVEIKMDLHSKLKIKDLGRLLYFLGMELLRSDEGILQCQKTWIFQMKLIWKKLSLQKLLDTSFKLEPNGKPVRTQLYIKDECPVSMVSQLIQEPRMPHWNTSIRILRYLKKYPSRGMLGRP